MFAPASVADPSSRQAPLTESEVEEIEAEVARLESEFEPAKGTARTEVEARYGAGRPSVVSKVPVANPPKESRYRVHEFCADGTLAVQYDDDWRVSHAHWLDPYSTKGQPVGRSPEPRESTAGLRERLHQMRRIREEHRRRFGE